jgi:hypothetical protein
MSVSDPAAHVAVYKVQFLQVIGSSHIDLLMSLIVSIGLSSSLAAAVTETAVGEIPLALALVVAILRGLLAVASRLFCAIVLCGSRVCSWRRCGLVDSGASVFHDCCRVVHSMRLVCIGVE